MSAPFQKVQFFCLFGKKWIKIPPLSSEVERWSPVPRPGPSFSAFGWTAPNPICCGDSGGRAGLLTKPYKIEQVQIL